MRRLALALLALATLAAPAAAQAVTRYVTPTGADAGDCRRAAPCSAAHAIAGEGSAAGDTVVVLPGVYDVVPLVISRPLLVTARPDDPRPLLHSATGTTLTVGADAAGTVLEHLALRASGGDGIAADIRAAAVIDDVRARSSGTGCLRSATAGVRLEDSVLTLRGASAGPCVQTTGADTTWDGVRIEAPLADLAASYEGNGDLTDVTAVGRLGGLALLGTPSAHRLTAEGRDHGLLLEEGSALVTDTLALARRGGSAVRARAGEHELVNLTVQASGAGSAGIRAQDGAVLTVKNTIARAADDLAADPGGQLSAVRSNFRRGVGVLDFGANQGGSPRFVAAGRGDFGLRPGSPAIDAGSFEINAASADRAGRFRWLGDAPDIGAFEYAPPRRLRARRDRKAPVLRAVALSTDRLRPGRRGVAFSAAARPPRFALLRWFVSERSDIVMTVRRAGRRQPVVGTIVQPAALGWGALKLSGELDGRPLARGRYVLRIVARDVTQNLSRPRDVALEIR